MQQEETPQQQPVAQTLADTKTPNEILGTWKVVQILVDGVETDSYSPTMTFGLETVTTTFDQFLLRSATAHSTYRIDSSTSPKTVVMNNKGKLTPGIYKIHGDTLQVCTNKNKNGKSPTAFESKADSDNNWLVTLRRINTDWQPIAKTTANADQRQILGGWKLIKSVKNGEAEKTDGKVEWIFAGKELSIVTKGSLLKGKVGKTYELAPSTTPKTLLINKRDETTTSIYEIQGDQLRICFNDNGNGMLPTEFESKADSDNNVLMTFERIRDDQLADADATDVAVSYFKALTIGDLEKVNELAMAPFSLDGKKTLLTNEEVQKAHERIMEKKGKRKVPAYKVVNADDVKLLADDIFPPHIVIRIKIRDDDEMINVYVTSDGDPKVIGFKD